jgi:anti-anti-sigma factor
MSLEFVSEAETITVRVAGDVDLASGGLLEEAMAQLGDEPRSLVVDLRGVSFIDSTGIRMLLRVHHACEANGGSLVVAAPSKAVRQLFDLAKVHEVITIVD